LMKRKKKGNGSSESGDTVGMNGGLLV
jgi:hypothetical protein